MHARTHTHTHTHTHIHTHTCTHARTHAHTRSEGITAAKLKDILIFFSGCDREPTTGFHTNPSLVFLRGKEVLATASTCSLVLRLPTAVERYDEFKANMELSFKGHGGINIV